MTTTSLPIAYIDKVAKHAHGKWSSTVNQLHASPQVALLSDAIQTVKERGQVIKNNRWMNLSPKMATDLQDIVDKLRAGATAYEDAQQQFRRITDPVHMVLEKQTQELVDRIKNDVFTEANRKQLLHTIKTVKAKGIDALQSTSAFVRGLQEHTANDVDTSYKLSYLFDPSCLHRNTTGDHSLNISPFQNKLTAFQGFIHYPNQKPTTKVPDRYTTGMDTVSGEGSYLIDCLFPKNTQWTTAKWRCRAMGDDENDALIQANPKRTQNYISGSTRISPDGLYSEQENWIHFATRKTSLRDLDCTLLCYYHKENKDCITFCAKYATADNKCYRAPAPYNQSSYSIGFLLDIMLQDAQPTKVDRYQFWRQNPHAQIATHSTVQAFRFEITKATDRSPDSTSTQHKLCFHIQFTDDLPTTQTDTPGKTANADTGAKTTTKTTATPTEAEGERNTTTETPVTSEKNEADGASENEADGIENSTREQNGGGPKMTKHTFTINTESTDATNGIFHAIHGILKYQTTDYRDQPSQQQNQILFTFDDTIKESEHIKYCIDHIVVPLQRSKELIHLYDAKFFVIVPDDLPKADEKIKEWNKLYSGTSSEPEPETITYRFQRLPVSMALPAIRFYKISPLWNESYIGGSFFFMGLKDAKLSKDEETPASRNTENRTEQNSLYILDENGNSRLNYMYNIGRKEYAANIGTFFTMAQTILPGAALASATARHMIGGKKHSSHRRRRYKQKRSVCRKARKHTEAKSKKRKQNTTHSKCLRRTSTTTTGRRTQRRRTGGGFLGSLRKGTTGMLRKALFGQAKQAVTNAVFNTAKDTLLTKTPESMRGTVNLMTNVIPPNARILGNLSGGIKDNSLDVMNLVGKNAIKSTKASIYDIGMRGVGGTLSAGVGLTAGILAAKKLYEYTSITPSEHREVWGNQIQDYVYYKGVHVGEPIRFYYETLEFTEHSKKFLVYYLQCSLPVDLHPRNVVNIPEDNEKGMPSVVCASTEDFIPIMMHYKKTPLQTRGPLLDATYNAVRKIAKDSNVLETVNQGFKTIDSKLEKSFSSILPPSTTPNDVTSIELRQRLNEKLHKLNRLTALNERLNQETLLHSLNTLEGRRIDMFYQGKDKVRSKEMEMMFKGIITMASAFAGKEMSQTLVAAPLLNMLTGGMGKSTATLGAGAAGAMASNAITGRLMQTMLRRFIPAVMYLFSKGDIERCKTQQHPYLYCKTQHNVRSSTYSQYGIDVLTASMNAPTLVSTQAPVPLQTIATEQSAIHVFFDQFSHNWMQLEATTPCHFVYSKDLGACGVRTEAGNAGVALAFEAGHHFREKTIRELLQEALYPTTTPRPDVPFIEELRVMLFGEIHEGSIEYETRVADDLMLIWFSNSTSKEPLFGKHITGSRATKEGRPTDLSFYVGQMPSVQKTRENIKQLVRSKHHFGGARGGENSENRPDSTNRTENENDTQNEDATTNPTFGPNDSFYTYRSDQQNKMDTHIRLEITTLLLKSLRRKLRKSLNKDDKLLTISDLCGMKYKEACTHTHVVAVIPFVSDEKGNQCRMNYQTGKRDFIGPFVICCKKPFAEFIPNGDFNTFMQRRFDDITNATYSGKDNKSKDAGAGKRAVLNATRVCLFEKFNNKPYDFEEDDKPPESAEKKLKDNIEKYSKIVKAKRDFEQHEWLEMHRTMQKKRQQVLREEQKYALNNIYGKLLNDDSYQYNMILPRTILPQYGDRQALHPRFRPLRHYEMQRKRRATIKNYNIAPNEDYDDYHVSPEAYETNPVNVLQDDTNDSNETPHTTDGLPAQNENKNNEESKGVAPARASRKRRRSSARRSSRNNRRRMSFT